MNFGPTACCHSGPYGTIVVSGEMNKDFSGWTGSVAIPNHDIFKVFTGNNGREAQRRRRFIATTFVHWEVVW
jgi:hypothetical protein